MRGVLFRCEGNEVRKINRRSELNDREEANKGKKEKESTRGSAPLCLSLAPIFPVNSIIRNETTSFHGLVQARRLFIEANVPRNGTKRPQKLSPTKHNWLLKTYCGVLSRDKQRDTRSWRDTLFIQLRDTPLCDS